MVSFILSPVARCLPRESGLSASLFTSIGKMRVTSRSSPRMESTLLSQKPLADLSSPARNGSQAHDRWLWGVELFWLAYIINMNRFPPTRKHVATWEGRATWIKLGSLLDKREKEQMSGMQPTPCAWQFYQVLYSRAAGARILQSPTLCGQF